MSAVYRQCTSSPAELDSIPSGVTCAGSEHGLAVRWAPPARAAPPYTLHWAPLHYLPAWGREVEGVGGLVRAGAATATTVPLGELRNVGGLAANYSVRVRTRTSPASPPTRCDAAAAVPEAVTTLRAVPAGESSVRVSWLAPTSARPAYYTLYIRELSKEGGEWSQRVEAPPEAAEGGAGVAEVWREVAGLRARVAHEFWVQVETSGNYTCTVSNGASTDTVTYSVAVIRPPDAPPAPRLLRARRRSLTLAWDLPPVYPAPAHAAPVRGYTLRWLLDTPDLTAGAGVERSARLSVGAVARSGDGGEARWTLRGLQCGARYLVSVQAHSAAGTSARSPPLRARTQGDKPRAPAARALVWSNSSALRLGWLAWGGGPAACRPRLAAALRPAAAAPATAAPLPWADVPADGDHAQANNLQPGTWYEIRVLARSPTGDTVTLYRAATLTLKGGLCASVWPGRGRGGRGRRGAGGRVARRAAAAAAGRRARRARRAARAHRSVCLSLAGGRCLYVGRVCGRRYYCGLHPTRDEVYIRNRNACWPLTMYLTDPTLLTALIYFRQFFLQTVKLCRTFLNLAGPR
ncbi:hypothetical protein ACJJTC_015068 [Scirpophaga incertulas]